MALLGLSSFTHQISSLMSFLLLVELDHIFISLFPRGFTVGHQAMLPPHYAEVHRSMSPGSAAPQQVT